MGESCAALGASSVPGIVDTLGCLGMLSPIHRKVSSSHETSQALKITVCDLGRGGSCGLWREASQ